MMLNNTHFFLVCAGCEAVLREVATGMCQLALLPVSDLSLF